MTHHPIRTVLISGASVAGPSLAFWLSRFGFEPTIVERSKKLREGGYAVDFRGTSMEALRRMAVLTWHYGFTVPGEDVRNFLSAGFSPDQYELMAGSINAALSAPRKIPA